MEDVTYPILNANLIGFGGHECTWFWLEGPSALVDGERQLLAASEPRYISLTLRTVHIPSVIDISLGQGTSISNPVDGERQLLAASEPRPALGMVANYWLGYGRYISLTLGAVHVPSVIDITLGQGTSIRNPVENSAPAGTIMLYRQRVCPRILWQTLKARDELGNPTLGMISTLLFIH